MIKWQYQFILGYFCLLALPAVCVLTVLLLIRLLN